MLDYVSNYEQNALHVLELCNGEMKIPNSAHKTARRLIRCWSLALIDAAEMPDERPFRARALAYANMRFDRSFRTLQHDLFHRVAYAHDVPGLTRVNCHSFTIPGWELFHDIHWWGLQYTGTGQELLTHDLMEDLYGPQAVIDILSRGRLYLMPYAELHEIFDEQRARTMLNRD